MKRGVVLISYRVGTESDPYRTGGWVVIKDKAISKMVTKKELAEDILKRRFAMVPDDAWCALGLPGIVPARAMHCANMRCENFEEEFMIPITRSEHTANISGEASVHCVHCECILQGGPVQYIPDPGVSDARPDDCEDA